MKLVLIINGQDKAQFELSPGSNLIGRWDPETKAFPEVDLEDHDIASLISRRHAMLTILANQVTLEDLGSTNGTFIVGGARLEAGSKVAVEPGAEFFIGNLKMRLEE